MRFWGIAATIAAFLLVETNAALCENAIEPERQFTDRIVLGDFNFNDETMKTFLFCVYYSKGIMDEEGNFNETNAVKNEKEEQKEFFEETMNICGKKRGSTKEETAWEIAKCIQRQMEEVEYPHDFEPDNLQCAHRTKAPKKLLWRLRRLDFDFKNKNMKRYVYCMLKKRRIIDKKGICNTQANPEMEELFKTCTVNNQIVGIEEAWRFIMCTNNFTNIFFRN